MRVISFAYIISALIIFATATWVGERFWLTGLILYVLPIIGLAPLFTLAPVAIWFNYRLAILWGSYTVVFFLFFTDFSWSSGQSDTESTLTVITHNVGQNDGQRFDAFIAQEDPDLIALQEVYCYGATDYRRRFPQYVFAHRGEFVLLSRFPILDSGYLESANVLIGAWFRIALTQREIMVFNIHFPSLRRYLLKLNGEGPLGGLIKGDGIFAADVRKEFALALARRVRWAQDLVANLERETRPFLVVGDLNISSQGYLYRLFATRFADVFYARGRGWGYTFPGDVVLWGFPVPPWLRLDYLFSSPEWVPVYCRSDRGRQTQHRAVSAAFYLPSP